MIRAAWYDGVGALEALRSRWDDLALDAPSATPFQTSTWQLAWWRHYGGYRRVGTFTLWDGNDLVGLMPFIGNRGPWRTLRPMGVGPSDYLHPLARTGYETTVAEHLSDVLSEQSGVDLIDLHQVRETLPVAGHFGGACLPQATCLVLDLPKTFDGYLSLLGKSLRYDVRKLDKSPFQEGRAAITVCGPADIAEGLDIFFELHRRRWKQRHLPGAFLGKAVEFHRDWAWQAVELGMLRLTILRLDGDPVGAMYGMELGSTAYYYQAGFDPARRSFSPGTVLVADAIRHAIGTGKTMFDFMRGDEGYKRRWKPQREIHNLRYLIPGNGWIGRMGAGWNRTGFRLESCVRARLEGRGLW